MEWALTYTAEFETWLLGRKGKDQAKLLAALLQLKDFGPTLPFPLCSAIKASRHPLRELRVQVGGRPFRILYAFDPTRTAVVLLAGDKTGDDRWYERHVPRAEALFDAHLASLEVDPDDQAEEDA